MSRDLPAHQLRIPALRGRGSQREQTSGCCIEPPGKSSRCPHLGLQASLRSFRRRWNDGDSCSGLAKEYSSVRNYSDDSIHSRGLSTCIKNCPGIPGRTSPGVFFHPWRSCRSLAAAPAFDSLRCLAPRRRCTGHRIRPSRIIQTINRAPQEHHSSRALRFSTFSGAETTVGTGGPIHGPSNSKRRRLRIFQARIEIRTSATDPVVRWQAPSAKERCVYAGNIARYSNPVRHSCDCASDR